MVAMWSGVFDEHNSSMVLTLTINFTSTADKLEETAGAVAEALLNNGDNLGHMTYTIVDHVWDTDDLHREEDQ